MLLRSIGACPFPREAPLSTWITGCADVARSRRARSRSLDHDGSAERVTATLDRRFGDLELRDRLEKAIARLAPHYRLLIAAHYLDGVQDQDARRP